MPINIGQKADHSFSEPLGLLSDCHRRIELFLSVLVRLSAHNGQPLSIEEQHALEAALRYFRESAPKHTADEEGSLFPRLRSAAVTEPEVTGALAEMNRLEAEHRLAEALHAEVETLGAMWLDRGSLAPDQATRFAEITLQLRGLYQRHISFEDEYVFPLAGRVLRAEALGEIGNEMAERRQLHSGGAS